MMAPTLARYDPQRRALTRLDQTTYRFAMVLVNVYEAKTQLSKLLEAVERGEKVTIARAGRPIADLAGAEAVGRIHIAEALSYRRQAPRN